MELICHVAVGGNDGFGEAMGTEKDVNDILEYVSRSFFDLALPDHRRHLFVVVDAPRSPQVETPVRKDFRICLLRRHESYVSVMLY